MISDATTCTDLFKEYGACVDVEEVRDMLEDDQEELETAMDIKENLVELLDDIEKSLKEDTEKE